MFNGSQALLLQVTNRPKAISLISNNTFDSFTGVHAGSHDEVVHLNFVSDTNLLVKENQFRNNNGTVIRLLTPDVIFYGNSFENPTSDYNIKFDSTGFRSQVVNASFNYWGSADLKAISQKIYDEAYDFDLAQIMYLPFLGSWNISDVQETTSSFVGENSQIGGAVNGNITLSRDGSPFTVVSNIEIKYADVLIIEAGVKIYFPENVGITVVGSLLILGNSTHKVEMLSKEVGSKWRGIEFKPEFDNSGMIDVRLVNGKSPNEGRIELYYNGQWGTVCDDGFDRNDAKVICRMLGYDPEGGVTNYNYGQFGAGTGMIWLRYVGCNGGEKHIKQCSSNGWGNTGSCSHSEDAGVSCNGAHRISKRQVDKNSIEDKPRNLTAHQVVDVITSITLEWTSPSDSKSNLTGYRIKLQKQNSDIFSQIDLLPNITMYTLQNLDLSTLYYITIQAVYTDHVSANSDSLMFRTAKGPKPYSILRHVTVNDTLNGVILRGNIQEVKGLHSFYSKNTGLTIDFHDLTPIKYIEAYDVILRHNEKHGLLVQTYYQREETAIFLTNSSFSSNKGNGIEVKGNLNISVHQCAFFQNTISINIRDTTTSGSVKVYNSDFYQNSQYVLSLENVGYSMNHYNVEIKGCTVRDHDTRYYSSWRWQIRPLFRIILRQVPMVSVNITDNRIYNNVADGFYIYYTGNQVHNTYISRNLYTNNSYFLYLQTTTYNKKISNVTLKENRVLNCQDKDHPLVFCRISKAKLEIKNCTFFNNTGSSIIETGEFESSEIIISGNDVRNNMVKSAFDITMVNNVTIHHNILHNNATCELHVTEYADWLTVNAKYNYYGYKDLKNVIERVCGFDKDMGKIRIDYIPFLEELEFFPAFNSYVSSGSHSTFFNGDVIGGDIVTSVTLSSRLEPYVIDRSIFIRPGAKLIIEKGVTVRFKANRGIYVRVNFYGMYDSAPLASLISLSSPKSVYMVYEDQDSVTINCYAYSSLNVQFKWEKRTDNNVVELTDTDRYKIIQGVGFKILNPRRDIDKGFYRCSPYSKDGFVVGKWISLEFALSGEFPMAQPAPVTAAKYDGVVIQCPAISLSHPTGCYKI
ncbi:hypothetical protein KUTeg_010649 [Tegillarca granosa]|uniref:Uncharacterized protein n=1 Tax=Tegillarca granosa TaxID=220873 RepID=A0ABQ9F2Z6_TEGGR|nr:hypothetical protein KUTeg_010649 [Tegillarca granosa]